MKDFFQIRAFEDFRNDMNMIRHDAPREKLVALVIKMLPRFDDAARDFRYFQMTGAAAGVEKFIKTAVEPFGNVSALHPT